MSFLYWPYDEVSLEPTDQAEKVEVKTPWLKAKVGVPLEEKAKLTELQTKFKSKALTPNDLGLLNWFFSNLEKYAFCYILPTPKNAPDAHKIKDDQFLSNSLEKVIAAGLERGPFKKDAQKLVGGVLSNLPRKEFGWDVEAALSFSKNDKGIHPESVFSVVRRFHLLELIDNDSGREVFQYIESLPPEKFASTAALIVKQNLHVTEQCNSSLLPALSTAQSARAEVEHFIQAERGHDRLLGAALKALTPHPESVPVSSQTIALMGLLHLAAERNFLAFAMAVDFFERSSYEKTDPLAALLIKGGFPDAAKQINRHMEINDAGEHENMGLHFLTQMAPVDASYVREAFHLAEAVSLVMNSVTRSAVNIKKP